MAGRQRPPANARLSRDRLPRRGCESLPCRRCGRSCSPSSDAAANSLPSGYAGRAEEKSSKWIKGLAPDYRHLCWQRGYGAFSVSPSQANSTPSSNMWRPRKNTIAAAPSRKSTASSCTNTALSMTSVMRGIEAALVESRFQPLVPRRSIFLGRCPRLVMNQRRWR